MNSNVFIFRYIFCTKKQLYDILRIEHGGVGVKRGVLFKELYIYSCNYELFV